MIREKIEVVDLLGRLEFLGDHVLGRLPVKAGATAEIRRSSFQVEGGGFMYMLTFTVMPDGQKRAETPKLVGFEGRAEG